MSARNAWLLIQEAASADPEAVTFPTCDQSPLIVGSCACSVMAEAWAYRVADQMPDTSQGRRDSRADAASLSDALLSCATEAGLDCLLRINDGYAVPGRIKMGWLNRAAKLATGAARAAFRACPGLR